MRGDPQSPDGTAHYQPESALLHKVNGQWTVVDQPCEEDGCDEQERADPNPEAISRRPQGYL